MAVSLPLLHKYVLSPHGNHIIIGIFLNFEYIQENQYRVTIIILLFYIYIYLFIDYSNQIKYNVKTCFFLKNYIYFSMVLRDRLNTLGYESNIVSNVKRSPTNIATWWYNCVSLPMRNGDILKSLFKRGAQFKSHSTMCTFSYVPLTATFVTVLKSILHLSNTYLAPYVVNIHL